MRTPQLRNLTFGLVMIAAFTTLISPARAAFHLWNLQELYSNSSGTLQFIEMYTNFSSQQFVGGQQINVNNIGMTLMNSLTLPSHLPGDSAMKHFLIGTAGIQAAGGPAPDFIMPDGFLFTAGGSISFFGANSGAYSALPTDGTMSRIWGGGNNAVNSPTNFGGQSSPVVVPEPTSLILAPLAFGGLYWNLRRKSRIAMT